MMIANVGTVTTDLMSHSVALNLAHVEVSAPFLVGRPLGNFLSKLRGSLAHAKLAKPMLRLIMPSSRNAALHPSQPNLVPDPAYAAENNQ